MIIYYSEEGVIREKILNTLNKIRHKELKIVDVGGGMNSWASDFVTDIIDINIPNQNIPKINVFVGDLCSNDVWEQFPDNYFDFSICTHVIEDIRDPKYVLSQISRVSRAGFIAVPSKWQEISCMESKWYLGYFHHRWMYKVKNGELTAIAKLPLASISPHLTIQFSLSKLREYLNILLGSKFKSFKWNAGKEILFAQKIRELLNDSGKRIDHGLNELGIIWTESIEIHYVLQDFINDYTTDILDFLEETELPIKFTKKITDDVEAFLYSNTR